jgi:hypothetical protein
MARSQSTSISSTDLDPSASAEEKGRGSVDVEGGHVKADELPQGGSEKQSAGLRQVATRDSNTQAIPGVRLDESDFEDGSSHGEGAEEGRGRRGSGVFGLADRVISRTTSKSSFNPGPPPDGGLRAWTAVAAGHLVIMNTWGYINSFGVFQTYYATELQLPPATISWIGSIQVFLLFFIGTFTGRITDAGVSDTSCLHPLCAISAALMLDHLGQASRWREPWR